MDDLYLMHHGIKGMQWGVRRYQNSDGTLTDAGKRRYGIQDARKYYKVNRLQRYKERTKNARTSEMLTKEIRRTQTRSDRKKSLLNQQDINAGRQIVASNRMKMAMAGTIAKGAVTAAGIGILASNPRTRWAVPAAAIGGAALTATSAKKVPYYTMENHRYKQSNTGRNGVKTHGESKLNQRLRTAATVAGTTAAVAGTGYLAYKAGGKIGKNLIENRKYNNSDPITKRAIDAAKDYELGKKTRKVVDSAGRAAAKGAKRAYDFATSEETKAKVKAAGKTVARGAKRAYDYATSEETKEKLRAAGRSVKTAYRGYTGKSVDDEEERRRNQNRRR